MTQYTKEFILSLKHDETTELLYSLNRIRYPKNHQRRYHNHMKKRPNPKIHLRVGEDAWSDKRHKDEDELMKIEKNVLSVLNKLSPKNKDTIIEQFIELMDEDIFESLIPKIHEIVMKMLVYNDSYCNLIQRYNNKKFNEKIINLCKEENQVSLGKKEDTRKYTSLLEEPETIKTRYKSNNLLFLCDLYNNNVFEDIDLFDEIYQSDDLSYICLMMTNIHKKLKKTNETMYNNIIDKLKTSSKNKDYPAKIRFGCMDVLDSL